MRTGSQFRHHAAKVLVHLLGGNHVGQQHAVTDNGRRGVVAGRFYAQDNVCHFGCKVSFF